VLTRRRCPKNKNLCSTKTLEAGTTITHTKTHKHGNQNKKDGKTWEKCCLQWFQRKPIKQEEQPVNTNQPGTTTTTHNKTTGTKVPKMGVNLTKKILDKSAEIVVMGLGYVGLPLAIAFAKAGYRTTGYDTDKSKISALIKGDIYLLEQEIRDQTPKLIKKGHLTVSDNPEVLSGKDCIMICVPTPLTQAKTPDLSHIEEAARLVSKNLRPGMLVVLESTTYPGTTDEVLIPILEESGLKAGEEFEVAYSPERIDPGNREYPLHKVPKLVGGINPKSTEDAALLYKQITEKVVKVSSPKVAEAAKIVENIYRSVNIALVNELSMLFEAMGINTWEVIEAASTKPYAFQAHYPGPGVGGHCIPLDPFYLTYKAREYGFRTKFVELSGEINENMPEHVKNLVVYSMSLAGKPLRNSKISILGVTYKENVNDTRHSPAKTLIQKLLRYGARVVIHDPYVQTLKIGEQTQLETKPLSDLKDADCVVVHTPHAVYTPEKLAPHLREGVVIVDCKNFYDHVKRFPPRGAVYVGLGKPQPSLGDRS